MMTNIIVINASVGISESYVATPEKEAAIKNCQRKNGERGIKKGAMEELRLAGVGVMEKPISDAAQNRLVMQLADAQKLA